MAISVFDKTESGEYQHARSEGAIRLGRSIPRLSETATVRVVPSLLTAEMSAGAHARAAVAAQRQVNKAMRDAAALSGKVEGVKAVFRNYATNFAEGTAHAAARHPLDRQPDSGAEWEERPPAGLLIR